MPDRPLVNTKEVSRVSSLFSRLWPYLNNTDPIAKKKASGKLGEFYDEITDKDPTVRSCLDTRKKALKKLGWHIEPYIEEGTEEPSSEAMKHAEAMRRILNRMVNFSYNIRESLSCYEHGYSVSELMFRIDPDFVVVSDILHRKPDYFKFDQDGQLYFIGNMGNPVLMPAPKFLVCTFDPKYEDPYGSSLLKTAYWPHWFKTNLSKFLLIYAERFGQPTVVAQYPKGITNDEKNELLEQLEQIQNDTRGIVPEGSVINFLEAVKDNQAMFRESIQYFDDQIRLTILGQTLTSSSGNGTGSYALGKVHDEVRSDILADDAEDLGNTLTEQVIGTLMLYNFPGVVSKPKLVIPYKQPADLLTDSQVHERLSKFGLKIPVRFIYEHYQIPAPEEGEEVLEAPVQPSPFGAGNLPFKSGDRNIAKLKVETEKRRRASGLPAGKTFDIASVSTFYDELYDYVGGIIGQIERELTIAIRPGMPMHGLIDQAIRNHLGQSFNEKIMDIAGRTSYQVARDFAVQFNQILSESTFQYFKNSYLQNRFYQKGVLNNIAANMRNVLKNQLPDNPAMDHAEIKKLLQETFSTMKDWKAQQIAITETQTAAHEASISMIKQTGLKFRAHFLVDPQSCDICQEVAANGPYTVEEAERMGLPHIQCNDQYTYELVEATE